jgi:proline iminopeptidase
MHALTAVTPDGPIVGSVHGEADAPPSLLMLGGPGLTDYMELIGAELDGWCWITYQQRGVAPSAVNGPFTIDRHVADAAAVLDELQISRAFVLGHSWGGHLALQFALSHQDRVAGLVLVDPLGAVGDGGAAEVGRQLAERLSPAAAEQYAQVAARLAGPEPTDADFAESLKLVWPGYYAEPARAPSMPEFVRGSLAAYAGTFTSVGAHLTDGLDAKLHAVAVPVVFVLGECSPMPLSQGQRTAALLPASQVHVVPAAGHLPWHEAPGCVAAALTEVRKLAGT